MKIKILIKLGVLVIICFAFASDDPDAIKLIENSTSGIIGSVLGGITAGISIIFGILSTLKKDIPNISDNNDKFVKFLGNLKLDIKVLVYCLILSILLPYFRVTGIPFFTMPVGDFIPKVDVIYTTLELTIIVISMFALLEIISVMFNVFQLSLGKNDTEDNKV